MYDEEARQLDMFFTHYGISKEDYELHPKGKNHPPDARAKVGGINVSIEHTRLTRQELRRYLSLRSKLLDTCKELLDACKLPFFWTEYSVHILLKPGTLNDRKIQDLANDIGIALIDTCPTTLGQNRVRIEGDGVVLWMRLSSGSEKNKWQFVEDRVGWVTASNAPLIDSINKKEQKLSSYCARYDENWLLVCFSRRKAHGFFELDLVTPITSSFDRVFVMSGDDIVEVGRS